MLGLIIFGTRGVTYGSEGGQFYCPDCEGKQAYLHRKVRRFFTLYFIPLIPLDLLGDYVECQGCASTYTQSILTFDPEAAQEAEEAAFRQAMRRVLVLMMLADGHIDEAEIEAICSIVGKLEDRTVTRAEIDADVAQAQEQATDLEHYCRGMAGYLNDTGREMVMKAAILVASADGHVDASEREALASMASALNMSRAHFAGVISDLAHDPAPPAAPAGPPN